MARLQILELPEGSGDDRPPFVLIVDQYEPRRYITGLDQPEPVSEFDGIAEKIGARAILVFEEAVDIPANDVSAYLDSGTDDSENTVRVRLEPDFTGWDDALATALARVHDAVANQLTLKLGDRDIPAGPQLAGPTCCTLAISSLGQEHAADCPGQAPTP